jgi:hypothetical protein
MAPLRRSFDVVVVGNTSAGVAAALSAARTGRALRHRLSVALVYDHPRTTGGMLTNGVCSTDIRPPYSTTIPNGLFREFIDRVAQHYRRSPPDTTGVDMDRFKEGLIYEPEVAFSGSERCSPRRATSKASRGWSSTGHSPTEDAWSGFGCGDANRGIWST